MGLEQVCRKKDKRLLVLLALGTLIIFSDLDILVDHKPVVIDHFWVETWDKDHGLYRLELSGHTAGPALNVFLRDSKKIPAMVSEAMVSGLKQGRVVGLHKDEQGQSAAPVPVSPRLAFSLGQPFSINTAEVDDLTLIPGVGPALAGNIISYRDMHGPITAPHQLENISGIGPRLRSKLQNYFTYFVDSE